MFEHEKILTLVKEEYPWAPDEELGEWKLKRWNWFEKQRAVEKSSEVLDKKKGIVELNVSEYYAHMILKTAVEAPLELSLERVKTLDPQVGGKVIRACRDINGLTWEEKMAFLEDSDSENDTPGKPSTGPAKT